MIVFGSPGRYVQGPGVLAEAGVELARLGDSAVLLIDPAVRATVGAELERSCARVGLRATVVEFGGECSADEVDRLQSMIGPAAPGVLAAAGGGKCLDAGKALGARLRARIATLPTIASNDAPTSHIYVLYDANHRLLSVEKLERNPDLVLVDTEVIARAPAHLLSAGIGDALVKKYEVEQCVAVGGRNVFGSSPSLAALAMARACHDVLRADAPAALAAVRAQAPSPALERVVEACVLMSGLSFESGGLCIAHAMTRGLTAIPALAHALHGHQVAVGLMVQLVLENRSEAFLLDHVAFCAAVGLPVSLGQLGLADADPEQLETIADLTLAAPHMRNFERPVDRAELVAAMRRVEALAAGAARQRLTATA